MRRRVVSNVTTIKEETVKKSFACISFANGTLIEYYKKQGVYHEIDGLQEIGKVYADVKASLGALK